LKSCIKNEAIRKARKAVSNYISGNTNKLPEFKGLQPISINNQNWDMKIKNGKWYIGFTSSLGKLYLPVVESFEAKKYFHYFERKTKTDENRCFRGTIQLFRKGTNWYAAIPFQISSKLKKNAYEAETLIGVDLGLRHIAVVSEPESGKRKFFSGKQVGYLRRHFRSLRKALGERKALRAIKTVGKKERRCIRDFNRKLAKEIVEFAYKFPNPVIKMERLSDIRKECKTIKHADRTIHSWAFYQLQDFIKEKAQKYGIPVVLVEARYTSQTCFKCGHTEKANRNGTKFLCKRCGHRSHADLNASKNIAVSTALAV
jgi:IS605 OrfB family transposase